MEQKDTQKSEQDFCEKCEFIPMPSKELANQCLEMHVSSIYSPEKVLNHDNFICVDIADTLVQANENGTDKFPSNSIFLEKTVDSYLMRYFWSQAELSDGVAQIPWELEEQISSYLKTPLNRRKPLIMEIPQKRKGQYFYDSFAFAAKLDLTCKALYMPKNARSKGNSLSYIGVFFSGKSFESAKRHDKETLFPILQPFQLEDYIYYELHTRISFVIEICAVLLDITDKTDYEVCKKVLKENLKPLLRVTGILSRIVLARQCLLEAKFALETMQYQRFYVEKKLELQDDSISESEIIALKEEIARERFQQTLCNQDITNLFMGPCGQPWEETMSCNIHARQLLSSIKAPVDIIEYVENPIYGPVAFCNPKHPHVKTYLDMLKCWNAVPPKTMMHSKSKADCLFVELYQATSDALPDKLSMQRERVSAKKR